LKENFEEINNGNFTDQNTVNFANNNILNNTIEKGNDIFKTQVIDINTINQPIDTNSATQETTKFEESLFSTQVVENVFSSGNGNVDYSMDEVVDNAEIRETIEKIQNNSDATMRLDTDLIMQKLEEENKSEEVSKSEKQEDKKEKAKHEKKKKLTKKQKVKIILASILALFTLLGVVFGVYVYKADGNIAEAVLNVATDVLGEQDPIFVLVLGVSEDISSKLTDTIILCGYNPDTQKAFMLSIPRDTFIGKNEETAGGFDKINALYQKDVMRTVEAVEKLTGVNIDNYVVVKNTALPAIVNAIGEVEFDVPIDMDYDDPTQDLHIHLKKGVQKIDGDKAEQLLRFRHNNDGSSYPFEYGDNDYGRMRTQRAFITATAKQLITFQNVSNLKKITSAVFDNLETNMNLGKVLGYVPHALKYNTENLRAEQLPGASAWLNNLSFYKANSSQTKKLMDELIESLEMEPKENEKFYTRTIVKSNSSTTTKKDEDKENKVQENSSQNSNVHEHDYSVIVTETDPTCVKAGKSVRRCRTCGDTVEHSIPATGNHNFVNGVCTVCKQSEKNNTTNNGGNSNSNTNTSTGKDPKPTPTKKPEPTKEPEPTPSKTPEPTKKPEPTQEPTPTPTQVPTPTPTQEPTPPPEIGGNEGDGGSGGTESVPAT